MLTLLFWGKTEKNQLTTYSNKIRTQLSVILLLQSKIKLSILIQIHGTKCKLEKDMILTKISTAKLNESLSPRIVKLSSLKTRRKVCNKHFIFDDKQLYIFQDWRLLYKHFNNLFDHTLRQQISPNLCSIQQAKFPPHTSPTLFLPKVSWIQQNRDLNPRSCIWILDAIKFT